MALVPLCITAQDDQHLIDSLKNELQTVQSDTQKVNLLIELSSASFSIQPRDAERYAERARTLSEEIGFTRGLAFAYKNLGLSDYYQSNWVDALNYWKEGLALFEKIGDKSNTARLLTNLGAIYFSQSKDIQALEYYLKSQKVAEEIKDTLRLLTVYTNIGAIYGRKASTYQKAIDYDLRALKFAEQVADQNAIGTISANIGEIYLNMGQDSMALPYLEQSLKAYEGSENVPYALNNLGKLFTMRNELDKAIEYHKSAYNIAEKLESRRDMTESLKNLAQTYEKKGDDKEVLSYYLKAQVLGEEIKSYDFLKEIYIGISEAYTRSKDFENAYKYQLLYSGVKDTIYNIENTKRFSEMLFEYDIEKKQSQIDLQESDLKRQKFAKNSFLVGLVLVFLIAFIIFRNYRIKARINRILDHQKVEIENLLLNILPEEVAQELKTDGHATPRYYDNVSVLFSDFKSFTKIADGLPPQELVAELNDCFVAFDEIIEKHNLEKIKTIGDAYMCAGGIPTVNDTHPVDIIKAAIEIQAFMKVKNEKRVLAGLVPWELRIGVNTGPIVAGVVGKKKYAYDIWGSAVNVASRMESNGEPGKINISDSTYKLIKKVFPCTYRGKISAKNIGVIDMYFVDTEFRHPDQSQIEDNMMISAVRDLNAEKS